MPQETPIRVDHIGIAVEGRFRWAQYDFNRDASRLELIAPEAADTFLTEYLAHHGSGLHHVTLEVADIDAVEAVLEDNGYSVVEYREYDDWTGAFVPPSNPTGALFQLFEYHDSYDTGRPSLAHLYVDGRRLGEE